MNKKQARALIGFIATCAGGLLDAVFFIVIALDMQRATWFGHVAIGCLIIGMVGACVGAYSFAQEFIAASPEVPATPDQEIEDAVTEEV